MARGAAKALGRARLDQPGALAALSPGALAFLAFVGITQVVMSLISVIGYLPFGKLPYTPEPEILSLYRALAWCATLLAVLLAVEIVGYLPRRAQLPIGRIPVCVFALISACMLAYGFFLHLDNLINWPFRENIFEFQYDPIKTRWDHQPHD